MKQAIKSGLFALALLLGTTSFAFAHNKESFCENFKREFGTSPEIDSEPVLKAAENGNAEAQVLLAVHLFCNEDNIHKGMNLAFQWIRKAADQGYAPAQYKMGLLELDKREEWLLKAAEQGYGPAQYDLGEAYYYGQMKHLKLGASRDFDQAARWFAAAAEQGMDKDEGRQTLNVAFVSDYTPEIGRAIDFAEVADVTKKYTPPKVRLERLLESYKTAMEQENSSFRHQYWHVMSGWTDLSAPLLVSREIVEWTRQAAERGDAGAQVNLGVLHALGLGVEANDALALQWFKKAAERGEEGGQNNLAALLAQGRGAPKDTIQAYAWYSLITSTRKDAGGNTYLLKRALVKLNMTPEEVAEAERRAALGTPATPSHLKESP